MGGASSDPVPLVPEARQGPASHVLASAGLLRGSGVRAGVPAGPQPGLLQWTWASSTHPWGGAAAGGEGLLELQGVGVPPLGCCRPGLCWGRASGAAPEAPAQAAQP